MDTNRLCFNCFGALGETHSGYCPHCGYPAPKGMNPPHHLRCGSVLYGKYLVGRTLGQGGFGITYAGWDLNLGLKVAVKEYYPEGSVTREQTLHNTVIPHTGQSGDLFRAGREKFISEARTLAKFANQPGVVNVRDFFEANGTAYIVMEYLEGETLRDIAARRGRMPAGEALALLRPLMTTLSKVHAAGLLHRDISPDNIMVLPDGTAKLLDFGAARQMSVQGERSNTINVKHGYAPEEQYRTRGEQGPWTDIYALCATLYKLTTGQVPPQVIDRLAGEPLTPPNALGADFTEQQQAALLRGLSIRGADRQQSAQALIFDLYAAATAYMPPGAYTQAGAGAYPAPPAPTSYVPPAGPASYTPPAAAYGPVSYASAGGAGAPPAPKKRSRTGLVAVLSLVVVAAVAVGAAYLLGAFDGTGKGVISVPSIQLPGETGAAASGAPAATDAPQPTETPAGTGEAVAAEAELPDLAGFFGCEVEETTRNGGAACIFYADGSDVSDYLSMLYADPGCAITYDGRGGNGESFLFRVTQNGAAVDFYSIEDTGKILAAGVDGATLRFREPEVTAYWLNCNGITYARWETLGGGYGIDGMNYAGMPCGNMIEYSTAVTQGDTLYYTDLSNGAIYARSLSAGTETQISYEGEFAYGLNVVGDMLYFFCITTEDIYQIRYLDLSAAMDYSVVLIDYALFSLVIGDYLYYVDYDDYCLYRMDLTGDKTELLVSDGFGPSDFAVDDEGIVYIDTDGNLCFCNPDGSGKTVLQEIGGEVYELYKWGEWVYYEDPEMKALLRYSMYTGDSQFVLDPFNVDADNGYYVAYGADDTYIASQETGALYRQNIYSEDAERLTDSAFYPFIITDRGQPAMAYIGGDHETLYLYDPRDGSTQTLAGHS